MAITSLKSKEVLSNLTARANVDLGAMIPIMTTTVGVGGTSSVVFSNIPQNYEHLHIRGVHQESIDAIAIQFNSDTGNNYSYHYVFGDGGTSASYAASTNMIWCGTNYGSTGTEFGATVMDILDYSSSNKYKTVRSLSGATNNSFGRIYLYSGLWQNTNAISTITLRSRGAGTLIQNSSFALYGIKRAGA